MIRFGPAGIPLGCEGGTLKGVEYCKKIGLGAMEVEFVRGVKMGRETALAVGKKAKELGIALSCHCPYWINCCAKEPQKLDASVRNLMETARAAQALAPRAEGEGNSDVPPLSRGRLGGGWE